jgi:hypothetical protein
VRERRREKGEGRREKGEGRRVKGEGRREKGEKSSFSLVTGGEGWDEGAHPSPFPLHACYVPPLVGVR